MKLKKNVDIFGNHYFQIFCLGGNPYVLLEGGVSGLIPILESQLKSQLVKPYFKFLVILHAHFDHVCGIPGLKKLFPEIQIAASSKARDILKSSKIVKSFFKEDALMNEKLRSMNLLIGTPGPSAEILSVDYVINDQECWEIGKESNLKFYYAPGHSPCSMAAYLLEDEILFSSDCAGFPITNNRLFPTFFESYQNYINSIVCLSELNSQIVANAHKRIIIGKKNVKKFWKIAIREAELVKEKITKLLKNGFEEEEISNILFSYYYTDNLQIYSANNIKMCCDLLIKRTKEFNC